MADTDRKPIDLMILGSSCITRLLFWGPTIYILYLCFLSGYSLLTLHVAFFTLGCTLLMIEATLVVSGDALLTARFSKPARVRLHWILHFFGLGSLIVGLVTIIINKNRYGLSHFTSDHGKLGLSATIIALIVGVAAVPTLFRKVVPEFINFGSFKRTHIYFGIISFILLWATQITGLYTNWWNTNASSRATDLTLSAYIIGGFLLLIRPLYSTLRRSFSNN